MENWCSHFIAICIFIKVIQSNLFLNNCCCKVLTLLTFIRYLFSRFCFHISEHIWWIDNNTLIRSIFVSHANLRLLQIIEENRPKAVMQHLWSKSNTTYCHPVSALWKLLNNANINEKQLNISKLQSTTQALEEGRNGNVWTPNLCSQLIHKPSALFQAWWMQKLNYYIYQGPIQY